MRGEKEVLPVMVAWDGGGTELGDDMRAPGLVLLGWGLLLRSVGTHSVWGELPASRNTGLLARSFQPSGSISGVAIWL